MLQFMGLQRVRHNSATKLTIYKVNNIKKKKCAFSFQDKPGLHLEMSIPCLADHWTIPTSNPQRHSKPQGSPKYPAWVPKALSA